MALAGALGGPPAREQAASPVGLDDHLLWQLHPTPLSARARNIGVALIGAVGDDGYLTDSVESIRDGLHPEIVAELAERYPAEWSIEEIPEGMFPTSSGITHCLHASVEVEPDTAPPR